MSPMIEVAFILTAQVYISEQFINIISIMLTIKFIKIFPVNKFSDYGSFFVYDAFIITEVER